MRNKIMELKKYKIGNVLELQRGYDLPSSQMIDGNVLVAGSNGIIGTHNVARGNSPCITVGRSGSVGKVHFYEQPVWVHNTSLFVKDFKGNDPKYLFYFLRNLHLDEIFGKSSSVVPSLDRKVVHAMTTPFQNDIDKQKDISYTLSLLDQKIALNRAINRNLEAMAKQLYDYWFVQFDFPNEEGKPYKSSGGKMVWNEKLKREIPDGWEVTNIGGILDKVISTPRLSTDEYLSNGTYPVIDQTTDVYYAGFTNNKDAVVNQFPAVVFGDHSCAVKFVNFPFVRGADGTQVMLSNCSNISIEYLYFVVKGIKIGKGYARHYSFLKEQPIIKPSIKEAKKFESMAQILFEQITRNRTEILSLTKQRDELLPLLMNGQVSVNSDLSAC